MSFAPGIAPAPAANGSEPYREDLNNLMMCQDCKEDPPNLVEEYSSGDMVCGSCGLVLGARIIDTRSEWRTFSNDDQGNDDPSRVGDGPNALLDGDQLETTIAYGQVRSKNARDLTRTQNKIADKNSKTLMAAYREIGTLCDKINAGKNVSDATKLIFKQALEANFLKGKPQDAVIAGCIFISCRQLGAPRSFREIFSLTKVTKKEIGRVFKQLELFLGKSQTDKNAAVRPNQQVYNQTASTTAREYCGRFINKLNFRHSARIERVAGLLADKVIEVGTLAGRSPLSLAAASIYAACHLLGNEEDYRTSKQVAAEAQVSEGTLKTSYKNFMEFKEKIIEVEWLDKGTTLEQAMARLPPG